MTLARKFASGLLRTAIRYSSGESRCWGEAMLRELDFVESDRAALFWAAGSFTALFRHSAQRQLSATLERVLGPAQGPRPASRKAVEGMLGVAFAGALLAVLVCGLWRHRVLALFPQAQWERATVAVIAGLEIAYLRGAIALWRHRRPLAMGILLAGLALTVHVAIHTQSSCHDGGPHCEHNQEMR